MTQSDDKLELPRWSKLDNSHKFLYIFSSINFLTISFMMIIYYNIIADIFYSLGSSIIISGVIIIVIVHILEGKNAKQV